MTPDRAIETAADYADALMTSRRAKNVLVLVLLLIIIAQLVLFFLARFDLIPLWAPPPADPVAVTVDPPVTPDPALATDPAVTADPAAPPRARTDWRQLLHYGVAMTAFLGVTLSIVLSFVVILIVNIMLVGRLIGVGRVTSAYIWSLILVVLLFPWQAFLSHVGLTPDVATWKIPGVLYTFFELIDPELGAKFPNEPLTIAILKWARFVIFPLIAILILLAIHVKSGRALRQALGEEQPEVRTDTNPM